MKRIYRQVFLAIFLLSNNHHIKSMENDDPQECGQSFTMECFKYIAYSGMFSFALYKFGHFFYGGYQDTLNTMQRKIDLNTRILGTFLAANVNSENKAPRIQELLGDDEERSDFLNVTDSSDKKLLELLFIANK
jgi:hypothetical protein